ncbi:MAG: leucine-rich repeat domain-containing protein [Prevotella sp.]|nr:leucine-rich repeat domain-containing protein [Prevotella sp.]
MTIGYGAFIGSSPTSVTIPNSVTSIGEYAFKGCSGLTSVTIGNSVTSIGYQAFYGCSSLTSVTIPSSVTSIELGAFVKCIGLASIKVNSGNTVYDSRDNCNAIIKTGTNELILGCKNTIIPNSVTSIGGSAFSGCSSLTSVTIPNSVTSIGEWGFYDCSGLTSVTIGNSVTSIGYDAFFGCSGLTSIEVNSGNTVYGSPYNCNAIIKTETNELFLGCKNTIIPNSVTSIGERAFAGCSGLTSVTIPNSVTSIGNFAFYGCSGLTSVTIPNSVTSIGDYAFAGCSGLTSVTIPNSVTSIGDEAFRNCRSLTSVTIPNSVTSIGDYAFEGCSGLTSVHISDLAAWCKISFSYNSNPLSYAHHLYLGGDEITDLVIPNSVTSIGGYAFNGCSGLTSVTIPNSVTSLGSAAFSGCSGLTSVTIPNSVTTIGETAFCRCSGLTSVTIPNSVTSIGEMAFMECSGLTSVTIPNSVTSIGGGTFSNCSGLTSVTIPNSVTSIGEAAFADCSSLTSVRIPNSVTTIGDATFYYCSGLTSVIVEASTPVIINLSAFFGCSEATLYVPKNSKSTYAAANYWKEFKAIKEYPDCDVNQDGDIDVVDVVDIARYVVDTPAETFDVFLADLNSDKTVNVADAVVLVNEIAGDTNWSRRMRAPQSEHNDVLKLTENDDNSLSWHIEGNGRYTAFQFDLYLPEDVDVTQMRLNNQRKQKHQLLYNKVREGQWRVVALSTSNREFEGVAGELLNIGLDGFATADVLIDNIHFVTAQGADVTFEPIGLSKDGVVTGVDYVSSEVDSDGLQTVYSLSGQRLNAPQKGLNIIGGKKVIIK